MDTEPILPVQNALVTHQSKTTGSWLDLIELTSKKSSCAKYCNSSNLFTKPNRNWWQRESHLSEPINCRCLSASYLHSTWGTPKITVLFAPKDIFSRVFLWVKTRVGPKKPGILTKGWPTICGSRHHKNASHRRMFALIAETLNDMAKRREKVRSGN